MNKWTSKNKKVYQNCRLWYLILSNRNSPYKIFLPPFCSLLGFKVKLELHPRSGLINTIFCPVLVLSDWSLNGLGLTFYFNFYAILGWVRYDHVNVRSGDYYIRIQENVRLGVIFVKLIFGSVGFSCLGSYWCCNIQID